jgi:hypothetical protein
MMTHRAYPHVPIKRPDRRVFLSGRPALVCRIVGMRLVRGYAISANSTIGSKKRVGGGFSQAREKKQVLAI